MHLLLQFPSIYSGSNLFTDFELEITIISNRQSIIQNQNHRGHKSQHQKQESREAKLDTPHSYPKGSFPGAAVGGVGV